MALIVIAAISAIATHLISTLPKITSQTSSAVHNQRLTDFRSKKRGYQVVYEAIKDLKLLQQSFFLIFTGRLIVFHTIIASLMHSPFTQALCIFLMNALMILYLLTSSPIKEKVRLAQQVSQELILFTVNTCVLLLACLDPSTTVDSSARRTAGGIILYCNLLLSLLGPIFVLILITTKLLAMRRANKAPSESNATSTNVADPSVLHQQREVGTGPRLNQMNNESTIDLVQDQSNQSQIRESPSIWPGSKHGLDIDGQLLGISKQNRLRGHANKKGAARNLAINSQGPSALLTNTLGRNQVNTKLDERSIDKTIESIDYTDKITPALTSQSGLEKMKSHKIRGTKAPYDNIYGNRLSRRNDERGEVNEPTIGSQRGVTRTLPIRKPRELKLDSKE